MLANDSDKSRLLEIEEPNGLLEKLKCSSRVGTGSRAVKPATYGATTGVPIQQPAAASVVCRSLSWDAVHARVQLGRSCLKPSKPQHSNTKTILKDVFGYAESGRMLAVMGSSGAGKTTLLNILTGRNVGKLQWTGRVRLNGEAVSTRTLRSVSAYVQQDDLFVPTMTVREHLEFHALMRMGQTASYDERLQRVEQMITQLNLCKCERSLIRGISGGERKRLAFATEVITKQPQLFQLLTDPSIMFCDEPTSGLDSFMALQVCSVLKAEAARGKLVIATVHQPSSQVFELFDTVYLMGEGRLVFAGTPAMAVGFFDRMGYASPGNFNPSDHYMRTLAIVPRREHRCIRRIKELSDAFACSAEGRAYAAKASAEWQSGSSTASSSASSTLLHNQSPYKASWCQQVGGLLRRSTLTVVREPLLLRVRLFQSVVLSLLTGAVYVGGPGSGSAAIMNINGCLFQLVANMTFNYSFSVVDTFTSEIAIFMREHLSGVYRVDAYYVSKIVAEVPIYILMPTIFTSILYWMSGLYPTAGAFFMALLLAVLTANVGISIGYAVSSTTADVNLALAVLPVIVIPSMLFAGFYLNDDTIPVYFDWLKYASFMRYSYQGLAINEWSRVDLIPGCVNSTSCAMTGDLELVQLGFDQSQQWVCVAALVVMIVIWRSIAFAALLIRAATTN